MYTYRCLFGPVTCIYSIRSPAQLQYSTMDSACRHRSALRRRNAGKLFYILHCCIHKSCTNILILGRVREESMYH